MNETGWDDRRRVDGVQIDCGLSGDLVVLTREGELVATCCPHCAAPLRTLRAARKVADFVRPLFCG